MRTIIFSLWVTGLFACATLPPASSPAISREDARVFAVAVSRDGSTLWYATGLGNCEVRALSFVDRHERAAFRLGWCPTRIDPVDDASLVLTDGVRRGNWKRFDGTDVVEGDVVAAANASNYVRVDGRRVIWERDSNRRDVGASTSVRQPSIGPVSGDLFVIARTEAGERIERITAEGTITVSPLVPRIDSFDVSPHGDELVFSAERDGNFDVAIASTDGKKVNWIPSDPADEVGVTWAPRGNKVSYLIRRPDSTLVRSVHVPTSFQLTFETPLEMVRALAWEPRAERMAMILDGPVSSSHVDLVDYSGANRTVLLGPVTKLGREPDGVSFSEKGAILLPPRIVRYGDALPLFVTLTNEPLGWADEVRDLDSIDGGVLRLHPADWSDQAAFAQLVAKLPWAAPDQVIVIARAQDATAVAAGSRSGQTLISIGTKPGHGRVFTERRLPSGAVAISAETWAGAMEYLRGRFQAKR